MVTDDPHSQDAVETPKAGSEPSKQDLEEAILTQMDKLEALCNVRALVDAGETSVPRQSLMHYSQMVEQETKQLRRLLDQFFSYTCQ